MGVPPTTQPLPLLRVGLDERVGGGSPSHHPTSPPPPGWARREGGWLSLSLESVGELEESERGDVGIPGFGVFLGEFYLVKGIQEYIDRLATSWDGFFLFVVVCFCWFLFAIFFFFC